MVGGLQALLRSHSGQRGLKSPAQLDYNATEISVLAQKSADIGQIIRL